MNVTVKRAPARLRHRELALLGDGRPDERREHRPVRQVNGDRVALNREPRLGAAWRSRAARPAPSPWAASSAAARSDRRPGVELPRSARYAPAEAAAATATTAATALRRRGRAGSVSSRVVEDVRPERCEAGLCRVAEVTLPVEAPGGVRHVEEVLHRAQPAVVVVVDVADRARPDVRADQDAARVAAAGGRVGGVEERVVGRRARASTMPLTAAVVFSGCLDASTSVNEPVSARPPDCDGAVARDERVGRPGRRTRPPGCRRRSPPGRRRSRRSRCRRSSRCRPPRSPRRRCVRPATGCRRRGGTCRRAAREPSARRRWPAGR